MGLNAADIDFHLDRWNGTNGTAPFHWFYGTYVCDWLTALEAGVASINKANITYAELGPNSNSALAYFLRQLPNVVPPWVGSVPFGLFGWNTPLPGLN